MKNLEHGSYYVGQSINVMDRVNSHFTGSGNGDVYADYKYGTPFDVTIVPLEGSGYNTLNSLEKAYINHYDASRKGYNRNSGNR